jgi:hypothetical protein
VRGPAHPTLTLLILAQTDFKWLHNLHLIASGMHRM